MEKPLRSTLIMVCIIILIAILGIIDYYTGLEVGFFVLYFIPISLTAWFFDKRSVMMIAVFTIIIWYIAEFYMRGFTGFNIVFQNGILRFISMIFVSFTITRMKYYYTREQRVNQELLRAQMEIKSLKGILPICSSCKKIRNSEGYWEQVEQYIRDHTDADFSHGLCEECAKKLYPEYYK